MLNRDREFFYVNLVKSSWHFPQGTFTTLRFDVDAQ
jgi:hypothetical protein